jgi:hypothetical protein
MQKDQFRAHRAISEELAHEIFEAVLEAVERGYELGSHSGTSGVYGIADDISARIQQAVANAHAELMWKLLNRRHKQGAL